MQIFTPPLKKFPGLLTLVLLTSCQPEQDNLEVSSDSSSVEQIVIPENIDGPVGKIPFKDLPKDILNLFDKKQGLKAGHSTIKQ